MTAEQVCGLVLALLVMGIGLVGSVLHLLPGAALIFLAALGHRLYFGPTGASGWVLAIVAGVGLLSMMIEFLASLVGARKLGATRRGMWGAIIGALVGLFYGLPGILLGPFVGAFLLEQLGGRPAREAARAGLGAVLGLLAGAVGQFACCLHMMGIFTTSVCLNSSAQSPRETLSNSCAGDVRSAARFQPADITSNAQYARNGPYHGGKTGFGNYPLPKMPECFTKVCI